MLHEIGLEGDSNTLYIVMRRELCEACPLLIQTLCHVGNADHGLVTDVGFSQLWRRMYNVKIAEPELQAEQWVERAKRGFAHALARLAEFMPEFVLRHSDADGSVIVGIERYEQTLNTSRKIPGSIFRQLGDIEAHILKPSLLMAMIKAMMSAPKEFQPCLFTPTEISLTKLKPIAGEIKIVIDMIKSAQQYIDAHLVPAKLNRVTGPKALDKLDIVFHVIKWS